MKCKHATREIPTDPHGKARYERAMRHMELAKEQGMSSEEIHAHKKFRQALSHANRAVEEGKSDEEAHEIFRRIMHGETAGKCKHRKEEA